MIVIAEQAVGAYATVTLSASDPVALEAWLVANAYTLPPNFVSVVTPYVMNGAYFVAVKLQNGQDTGAIEPLAFTYAGSEPMIPIILTSIAAIDDMPVEVWLLAEHRAVPINYLHVTISDAAIDWERRGANYQALISQAADEAGGQAFATDMAGPSDILRNMLCRAGSARSRGTPPTATPPRRPTPWSTPRPRCAPRTSPAARAPACWRR